MNLIQKIRVQWITARKKREDTVSINLLTVLVSDIDKLGKEKHQEPTDEDVITIIRRLLKSNNEMQKILSDQESVKLNETIHERKLLESFLPKQLTESELTLIIGNICIEVEAISKKDIGRVMKTLKERYGTSVNMQLASTLVKRVL